MAPLGRPVVPLVYERVKMESLVGGIIGGMTWCPFIASDFTSVQ